MADDAPVTPDSTKTGASASPGGGGPGEVSQAEIDAVMAAMNAASPATDAAASTDASAGGSSDALDMSSIDELLKSASFEDATAVQEAAPAPVVSTEQFDLPNFQEVLADAQVSSIDLLRDVELNVKIELGRSRMLVEDVLKLGEGSVVELDKLAGDPVDVFVNNRLVARGEVLVLNDNFCVRVNEIVAGIKEEGA